MNLAYSSILCQWDRFDLASLRLAMINISVPIESMPPPSKSEPVADLPFAPHCVSGIFVRKLADLDTHKIHNAPINGMRATSFIRYQYKRRPRGGVGSCYEPLNLFREDVARRVEKDRP
jgi:hypothetical protein